MNKLKILFAGFILALSLAASSPASADVPPAGWTCLAAVNVTNEIPDGPYEVLYAVYDQMGSGWVRAACWIRWNGGGHEPSCAFYATLWDNNDISVGSVDCN